MVFWDTTSSFGIAIFLGAGEDHDLFRNPFLGSRRLAGGALPGFFLKPEAVPRSLMNGLLGLAAGVMLAATSFSLVIPAIEYGSDIYGSALYAVLVTCLFIFIGGWGLDLVDKIVPHFHTVMGRASWVGRGRPPSCPA